MKGGAMAGAIQLVHHSSGQPIGTITEAQLATLVAALEEESAEDVAYYVNRATVDLLREGGADADLLRLLEQAIAPTGEAEVRWVRP
jgi:processive 1,2-diacylglycerol beta-glucosyltransferase